MEYDSIGLDNNLVASPDESQQRFNSWASYCQPRRGTQVKVVLSFVKMLATVSNHLGNKGLGTKYNVPSQKFSKAQKKLRSRIPVKSR